MAGYLGAIPVPQATQHRESFTATSGQTTFNTAGYTVGFLDVYLNGSHLSPADFTATNGSDVVLASGASADDVCDIISYTAFEVADQTFTGTTTLDGAVVINESSADVDFRVESNGNANMLFVDGGNDAVGIGTSSPAALLHLESSSPVIRLKDTDGGAYHQVFASLGDLYIDSDRGNNVATSSIIFRNDATERMRIDSSGNLLVGTTSTTVYTSGSGGDAGVNLRADGQISNSSNSASVFNRMASDGPIHLYYKDGSTVGSIGAKERTSAGRIFVGNSNTRLLFDNGVDSIIPVNNDGDDRDNAIDLGASGARFDDIYATNGTIQTSDRNEKQDIASLTAAEMLVAKRISALFKTFRWKDKVAAKGNDARTHSGIIAQDVQAAFTAEGLDAGDYSLFISSTWWEHDVDVPAVEAADAVDAVYREVTDSDGMVTNELVTSAKEAVEAKDAYTRTDTYDTEDEAPEGATSKTRMGIRYPELLSFLAAYNEQRFAAIETRLTALEG